VGSRGGFRLWPDDRAVTYLGTWRLWRGRRGCDNGPLACGRASAALGPGGASGSRGGCRSRGRRGRLLGLHGATQSFTVGLAPGAVSLRVLDRRRVALHTDSEVDANVQGFLVGQPQLTGKLVDADFLGQLVVRSSPIEGQRSIRDPEAGAALHSHTTPGTRTPVHVS
jgi:hypothetical protein